MPASADSPMTVLLSWALSVEVRAVVAAVFSGTCGAVVLRGTSVSGLSVSAGAACGAAVSGAGSGAASGVSSGAVSGVLGCSDWKMGASGGTWRGGGGGEG